MTPNPTPKKEFLNQLNRDTLLVGGFYALAGILIWAFSIYTARTGLIHSNRIFTLRESIATFAMLGDFYLLFPGSLFFIIHVCARIFTDENMHWKRPSWGRSPTEEAADSSPAQ